MPDDELALLTDSELGLDVELPLDSDAELAEVEVEDAEDVLEPDDPLL